MAVNPRDLPHSGRRDFLKGAGVAAAVALTLGFEWSAGGRRAFAAAASPADAPFAPNAFLRIGADDSVTVIAKHLEMGQGSYTGIATVVAEELNADWSKVRVESAPADAKLYANLAFGTIQGTGGSSAMANSWDQLREAGAKARAMLIAAAAQQWRSWSRRQASLVRRPGPHCRDAAGPGEGRAEGSQAIQLDWQDAAACRCGRENQRHGTVHARFLPSGHVDRAHQAAALVWRDRQVV